MAVRRCCCSRCCFDHPYQDWLVVGRVSVVLGGLTVTVSAIGLPNVGVAVITAVSFPLLVLDFCSGPLTVGLFGEPILQAGVPELVYRPYCAKDALLTRVVEESD